MKANATAFLASCAFMGLGMHAEKAQALPFRESCASMQAYFNALNWNPPAKFSGFENGQFYSWDSSGEAFQNCLNGYITESSPMGTKVCKGKLHYQSATTISFAKIGASWHADSSACRWR